MNKILLIAPLEEKCPESIKELAIGLANKGNEVELIISKEAREEFLSPKISLENSVVSCSEPEIVNYQHYASSIDFNDYDIIHDHSDKLWSYLLKEANALNLCSTLYHCPNHYNIPPPVFQPKLIGITKFQANSIANRITTSNIKFVYKGVRINDVSDVSNIKEQDFYVFDADIIARNGCHEAMALSKNLGFPLHIMTSKTPISSMYYDHISSISLMHNNITLWGKVSEVLEQINLAQSKALILPILWDDPFCNYETVIKAQALGTPVITMNKGVMPEIVKHGETGYLCSTIKDMEELLKEFDTLPLINYKKECRRFAEKFSYKNMIEGYLSLYHDILYDRW